MAKKIRSSFLALAAFAVTSFLVTAPAAAATVCVDPDRTNCEATIQAGVDAASAGDTVTVARGLYLENVVIPSGKDGLQLRGPKKAILDGDDPNAGVALTIQSNDVRVVGISIHNGQTDSILIDTGVGGTQIRNVTMRGPSGSCIEMADATPDVRIVNNVLHACSSDSITSSAATADNLIIRNNEFRACGNDCIDVTGDNIRVEKNTFESSDGNFVDITGNNAEVVRNSGTGADDSGVEISGDDALVSRNDFSAIGDEIIDITGNDAQVTKNRLEGTEEDAIEVTGADPVITNNRISHTSDYGIDVDCTPCTGGMVAKNRMVSVGYDDESGFDVSSDAAGLVVEKNIVRYPVDTGMDVDGTEIIVRGNRIETGGGDSSDEAMDVSGTGHQIERNTTSGWMGYGITTDGTDITIHRHKSFDNSRHGIRIASGATNVTVTDSNARNNAETGIAIQLGATGTTATGNRASNNTRVDLCDEGTGSTLSDNNAATTQLNTGSECPID